MSSLCPVARLKIKYSPGIDSANSLTRSLAASRSVATPPSQRTLPPPCLLKMSNGGTIALPISRAPDVNYVCNQTHAEESCGCYENGEHVSPPAVVVSRLIMDRDRQRELRETLPDGPTWTWTGRQENSPFEIRLNTVKPSETETPNLKGRAGLFVLDSLMVDIGPT